MKPNGRVKERSWTGGVWIIILKHQKIVSMADKVDRYSMTLY